MREDFIAAMRSRQGEYGLELKDELIGRLADYCELVQEHNPILHLVAPSTAEEFATRHVLESLTLLEYLPENARFADVGAGAGLPSVPCLIARDDLSAMLIESKEKKTNFLEEAAEKLDFGDRVQIVNRQFDEVKPEGFSYVTCRALDKFTEKLPRLLKWAKGRTLLFFGGNNLREALTKQKLEFTEKLMPMSEQRFLFIVPDRR